MQTNRTRSPKDKFIHLAVAAAAGFAILAAAAVTVGVSTARADQLVPTGRECLATADVPGVVHKDKTADIMGWLVKAAPTLLLTIADISKVDAVVIERVDEASYLVYVSVDGTVCNILPVPVEPMQYILDQVYGMGV
jgi:methionine aminopeptidase